MANGHGGKRPNSGRKHGMATIISERARDYAMQKIERELDPIIDASIEMAKGIWVTVDGKKAYKKAPDVNALKHVIDQIIGKPKETHDVKHSGQISLAELLGKGALDTKTD